MADFRTHLSVAAGGGALLAHGGWQAGLWGGVESLPLVALVTLGGILPDIDADHSRAIRLIFNLLAVLAVVAGALLLQHRLTPGELLVACGSLYLTVRYVAGMIFARFTVHRGSWHSLMAGALCGLITTALSYGLLQQSPDMAWTFGVALGLGYVIHLLLDELYSVDLVGARIKRSFGTALKLCSLRAPGHALIMLMGGAALIPWLPPLSSLLELVAQGGAVWR
ncbi:LexA-binding, inner membrane-associated putative hydrolase [Franzmannia pantelleriensis]|uniref:LexA-binding, inner membrane-associated putative hydrolase n=1 Tax=Franzmannia pantelleriensis TaxID=48727 RepID=A0A1G9WAS6_9GAMM|nr:metal-dependent hydrolase [Halomonas pantelleriensis]SDM81590.1 LexA-binding, inner membrane-associated putative hydrolase [Halomonas pantelleriensis]